MKTTLLTLLSAFLLLASPIFGQVKHTAPNAISNNIMVRMHKGEDPSVLSRLLPTSYELKVADVLSEGSDIWLLTFNDQVTDYDEVVKSLQKINTVMFAQPNREVELRKAPNDQRYGNQWQHDNIDSELAWDITTGGKTANGHDIVVALIESADLTHVDLKDNHWKNTAEIPNNGIDDDGNGYVDDYNGWNVSTNTDNIGTGAHGTNCAGMIGAKGDNSIGVAGINWDVKIMNIAGYSSPFTEANIFKSYNYALKARVLFNQTNGAQGAFVVATSASWGVDGGNPNDYPIWCSFYDDLGQAGILNVGATTNRGDNVDQVGDVPSGCTSEYMIGVTATNQNDIISTGYGKNTIDVAAPGISIYTTANNNGYTSTSGTSFATPLTAGLVGLLYSIPCSNLEAMALNNPTETAKIVRDALYNGVDKSQHLIDRTKTGGRINARNSIDLLMDEVCSTCTPPTNVNITSVDEYEAKISFDAVTDADSYIISIQVAGSGNWSDYTVTNNTHTFTGLTSCTDYEFHITTDCTDETSTPSTTMKFTTSGCGNCIDLTYCDTKATNPVVRLMVNSPASIQGNYAYTPTTNFGGDVKDGYAYGKLILVEDATANPNEGCNTLTNNAAINGNIAIVHRGTCDFVDKAMNAQNAGATAVIVINNAATAPIDMGGTNNNITIPAIMISQADGATLVSSINNSENPSAILGQQNEWIASFEIDGNNVTTGDNNGYNLNSSQMVLTTGDSYSFTLTPGYDGQPLEEYTRIWIDLNQDGTFDNSEMVFDQNTASTGELNDAFTIPVSTISGSTRMRVQMSYQGFDNLNLPDVCGDFTSGEVEDFCVKLTSGLSCGMKVTSTVVQPSCNEVKNGEISLNVTDGTPTYTYQWNNGGTGSTISNLSANNYSVTIVDGNGCDTTLYFPLNYSNEIVLNGTITNPTCPGLEDGKISVNATGGDNITYSWNNGPTTSTYSNIGAGNYKVTATDDLGCKATATYNLSNPNIASPTASYTANINYLNIVFNNSSTNGTSYKWEFGDGNSSNDSNPNHTYADEGTYTVCLTVYAECDTVKECKTITVNKDQTGLSGESYENSLNIYPNPSKGLITIDRKNTEASKVNIYDAKGQLVDNVQLTSTKTITNINNLRPGVYFFHILNKQGELLNTQRVSLIP